MVQQGAMLLLLLLLLLVVLLLPSVLLLLLLLVVLLLPLLGTRHMIKSASSRQRMTAYEKHIDHQCNADVTVPWKAYLHDPGLALKWPSGRWFHFPPCLSCCLLQPRWACALSLCGPSSLLPPCKVKPSYVLKSSSIAPVLVKSDVCWWFSISALAQCHSVCSPLYYLPVDVYPVTMCALLSRRRRRR